MCNNYRDIFHLPRDNLCHNNAIEDEIKVTDPSPICSKNFRYSEVLKTWVHSGEINNKLKQKNNSRQCIISSFSINLKLMGNKTGKQLSAREN